MKVNLTAVTNGSLGLVNTDGNVRKKSLTDSDFGFDVDLDANGAFAFFQRISKS